MSSILDVDLERSVLMELAERLPDEVAIDRPGEHFAPKARDAWLEPRLVTFNPAEGSVSRRTTPDDVVWVIRCIVKVQRKGAKGLGEAARLAGKELRLSSLVDDVRAVISPRRGAKPMRIRNCDGLDVGILQFGPPQENRTYNTSVTAGGDSIPGVDVATLTVPCQLTPGSCRR